MSDNFANYPESITEIASAKAEDCSKWTPRDALIATLRELDAGEVKPEALLIAYTYRTDDKHRKFSYRLAQGPTGDAMWTIGFVTRIWHKFMSGEF